MHVTSKATTFQTKSFQPQFAIELWHTGIHVHDNKNKKAMAKNTLKNI